MATGGTCTRSADYRSGSGCSSGYRNAFRILFLYVELTAPKYLYLILKGNMEYFLGIDIGTTSVKSIAFSRDGKIVCAHSVSYPIHHPFPDWSEQDPDEISKALFKTVENILQDLSPLIPTLCCFSSAMHSLIAVDLTERRFLPPLSGPITGQRISLHRFTRKIGRRLFIHAPDYLFMPCHLFANCNGSDGTSQHSLKRPINLSGSKNMFFINYLDSLRWIILLQPQPD